LQTRQSATDRSGKDVQTTAATSRPPEPLDVERVEISYIED
jgi:hypothetical protein